MILGAISGGVFGKFNNRVEQEIVEKRSRLKTKIIVNRL
jgi:hypothetical protein